MSNCQHHPDCISTALDNARKICSQRNARLTPIRKQVLEIIWENHKPTKAYDILARLQQEKQSAKPPTVYRALDFLLKNGLIHRLNTQNAFIGCSHPLEPHLACFLICDHCGEVTDYQHEDIAGIMKSFIESREFQAKAISIEIEGTCKACLH